MSIWVKGLVVDKKNEMIISWNQEKLQFHHLSGAKAGKLLLGLKDLVPAEDSISEVMLNLDYRYFYTGTQSGTIYIWKFDSSKKQIHEFKGHFKAVTSLVPVKNDLDLFLSSALDSTIRIWSLEKFE